MLQRLRHILVLVLFLLLPLHALFVTVGTKMLVGPNHPPFVYLAVWKELLIAALFVIGIAEMWLQEQKILKEMLRRSMRWTWQADTVTCLILALLAVAIVLATFNIQLSTFVFGFKYSFLPLIFCLLLKNLDWEKDFLERSVLPALFLIAVVIAAYGILSCFLPQSFFSFLGYSDAHSLYSPAAPLGAFQLIADSGIRRIQSTFAGPNQFGMWLLIPWSIGLVMLLQNTKIRKYPPGLAVRTNEHAKIFTHVRMYAFLILIGIALFLTFSRAAWVAAFVIALVTVCRILRGPCRETILITLVTAACVVLATLAYVSPQLFLRGISNQHHLERLRAGVAAILEQPLGRGLGSAGPASNRLQDACVYFPDGADTSWARSRKDLCLFVGNAQVQPLLTERKCQCAFLPENWYLQVGVELGVAGLLLFVALIFFILRSLLTNHYSLPTFSMFLGISIAALFLHAWEDSAVAYTIWGIAGIVLSSSASASSRSALSRLRGFVKGVGSTASA